MNINATILGQAIAFILFVAFCMKYVWPPIMAAIEKRQKEIAEGLASAERAKKDLYLAQANATDQLKKRKRKLRSLSSRRTSVARRFWTKPRLKLITNVLASWHKRRLKLTPSVNVHVKNCVSKSRCWQWLAPRRSSNVPWMKLLTATSLINWSLNCKEEGLMSDLITVARPYASSF